MACALGCVPAASGVCGTTVPVQLYWYNCTGTTVLLFVVLKTRDKMLKNGENTLSSWFVSLNQLNQQGS